MSKYITDSEFLAHRANLMKIRSSKGRIKSQCRLEKHHIQAIQRRKEDAKFIRQERKKKIEVENEHQRLMFKQMLRRKKKQRRKMFEKLKKEEKDRIENSSLAKSLRAEEIRRRQA